LFVCTDKAVSSFWTVRPSSCPIPPALLKSAASVLDAGENIELTTLANVGSVSVKKKVLTAAAAGIATGGLLMVNVKPRTQDRARCATRGTRRSWETAR
jgi:hypothetical protein